MLKRRFLSEANYSCYFLIPLKSNTNKCMDARDHIKLEIADLQQQLVELKSQGDFLVNNAGTGVYALFSETTEAEFDHLMNVHVKDVFFLTQKLLPLLNDGGRILNLSSGLMRFSYQIMPLTPV